MTPAAADFLALLEAVLGLEHELPAPAIAHSEAQAPQIVRERTEEIGAHIAVADDGKAFVRQNLAEARDGVEFARHVEFALEAIIINVALVVRGGVVVVVVNVAAERLDVAPRQTNAEIAFDEIDVKLRRGRGRAQGTEPSVGEPDLGKEIRGGADIARSHSAHA